MSVQLYLIGFEHPAAACPLAQPTGTPAITLARRLAEANPCGVFSMKLHHGAALEETDNPEAVLAAYKQLLNDPASGLQHEAWIRPVSDLTDAELRQTMADIRQDRTLLDDEHVRYGLLEAAHQLFPEVGFNGTEANNLDPAKDHLPSLPLSRQPLSLPDYLLANAPREPVSV